VSLLTSPVSSLYRLCLRRAYSRLEPDDEYHQVRFLGEGAAAMPLPYPTLSRSRWWKGWELGTGAGRNRPGVSLPPFFRRAQSKRRAAGSPPLCLSPLGSFLCDLGGWLRCLLRFLFRGELLLHLEGDGIGVHLVHGSGLVEYLSRVMPGAHVEDGGFN
jgi:hypothetical protein